MWIKLSSRKVKNPGILLSISQSINFQFHLTAWLYGHQTPQYILSRYSNDISTELKSMTSHEHDNKLGAFLYLYNEFCLQTYLLFGLPKRITKEQTKIRISSHDLLIERHVQHILSWRLGHENISTAILPLPLIQEEQLSVTGERMCTKYW